MFDNHGVIKTTWGNNEIAICEICTLAAIVDEVLARGRVWQGIPREIARNSAPLLEFFRRLQYWRGLTRDSFAWGTILACPASLN